MAWLFVRLKLSLIAGGLRGPGGPARAAGLIIAAAAALCITPLGFGLLASERGTPGAANVVIMVFTVFAFCWLTFPLITFSADETLDPARLMLLPLRPAALARGLLAAALTGIGPVFTFVVLLGAVVAVAAGPVSALVGVVGVTIELGLCVAGSRALITAVSGLLRSRRGRDLGIMVGALMSLTIFAGNLAFQRSVLAGHGSDLARVGLALAPAARIARWTPPGMTARAIADVAAGRYPVAAAEFGAGLLAVALATWIWIAALRRVLERADSSTGIGTGRSGDQAGPVIAGRPEAGRIGLAGAHRAWEHRLWSGRAWSAGAWSGRAWSAGAWSSRAWSSRGLNAAGRELRYYRRDPRRRQQLVNLAMPVVLIVINSPLTVGGIGPAAGSSALPAWPAVLGGAMAGMFSAANQFGMEGSSLWMNVVATSRWQDLRDDIAGKNLAGAAVTVPVFVVEYAALGWRTGDWTSAAVAFALLLCALFAASAVVAIVSVLLPVPVPERRSAFGGGGAGQGCLSALATFAALGVAIIAMFPVFAVQAAAHPGAWMLVIAPGYGAGLAWAGRRAAALAGYRRLPEVLGVVSRAL